MKRTILTTLLFVFAVSITTVSTATILRNPSLFMQDERKPVKQEELPEAVKTTLAGDEYKDQKFSEAFLVKSGATEYYEITLKNGEQETKVKLDKDGKKVD